MRTPFSTWVTVLSFAVASYSVPTLAQWQPDGAPVTTAAGTQELPTITSDGAGGAIVTWSDRSGNGDIYAQRIDASGFTPWTANGVALCTDAAQQGTPMIASDGAGGAIVVGFDYRTGNNDVYAQRIDASGAVQWTPDGVALCTAPSQQFEPRIASDGAGGAIVVWYDFRNGNHDIFAQWIDASGVVQWTADGVTLSAAASHQYPHAIIPDDAGGAIVAWSDFRSGTHPDIYAQRIDAAGVVQWTTDGVPLSTATGDEHLPVLVSDGAGGAIVTWRHIQVPASYDIYAQRIDATGAVQWAVNGVPICTAAQEQNFPAIASDGAGGAIVAWQDMRSATGYYDIYAQRVNASGAVQWTNNGVALCVAGEDQVDQVVASDGAGGAIVTWQDRRAGLFEADIYAQRIDASGAVQWMPGGVAFCAAMSSQSYPAIVSSGPGVVIVTWEDYRDVFGYGDIYAHRVDTPTSVGNTPSTAALTVLQNHPNPFTGTTELRIGLLSESNVSVEVYDVAGHRVRVQSLGTQSAGWNAIPFDGRDDAGHALVSGVYFYRFTANGTTVSRKMVITR
jgi:predicted lipoprotein with Yx(FWY)xxD motif